MIALSRPKSIVLSLLLTVIGMINWLVSEAFDDPGFTEVSIFKHFDTCVSQQNHHVRRLEAALVECEGCNNKVFLLYQDNDHVFGLFYSTNSLKEKTSLLVWGNNLR